MPLALGSFRFRTLGQRLMILSAAAIDCAREGDREDRPHAFVAGGRQPRAITFEITLGDRETQAAALELSRKTGILLGERFEQMRQERRVDPDPGVTHVKRYCAPGT